MEGLIDELKLEHKKMLSILKKTMKLGVTSEEGQTLLFSFKDLFLDHLKKEEKIYSILKEASNENDNIKLTLEVFVPQMQDMKDDISIFFKDNRTGDYSLSFAEAFGRILADMGVLIRREENILYREFQKYILNK